MEAHEFKKYSFVTMTGPGIWGLIGLIALLGIALGLSADTILESRLTMNVALFVSIFIFCNLFSGYLVKKLIRQFRLRWSYSMVLMNQILFFILMAMATFSSNFTLFDALVLWTVMSYTLWMFMLSGLGSVKVGYKSFVLSLVQIALIWSLVLFSLRIDEGDLIAPLILMAFGIGVSSFLLFYTEHLFSKIFSGISGLNELSKFLKGIRGEQAALRIGHNIDAILQYMKFRTGTHDKVIVAPWLHSGPIRSVGGGNLSTQCIEKLNREYSDSYFLHIPSNHEYNPSVNVSSRVVSAVEGGHFTDLHVSRMAKVEEGGMIVRGQRMNDMFLVSLASTHIDDYDIAVIASLRERYKSKNVLIVDSHPNVPLKECINVEAFTEEAALVDKLVDEVLRKLAAEPLVRARVGTAIQFFEEHSVFAMVVKAKETVLYFIADMNGLSPTEMETIRGIATRLHIDRVMFFTTDTHSLKVETLINHPDIPVAIIEATISRALKDLKPAQFSYGQKLMKNVRILGKTYYELTTVVKIMTRVLPIIFLLFFLFLGILLWIF